MRSILNSAKTYLDFKIPWIIMLIWQPRGRSISTASPAPATEALEMLQLRGRWISITNVF
jgi:hypothetical protein